MAAIVGLRRGAAREAHRPVGEAQAPGVGVDRLEVGARAEADAARAREDEHPRAVVGLEVLDALEQALGGRPVDRVAPVRAVDGEHGGGADPFVTHLVGHGADPTNTNVPGRESPGRRVPSTRRDLVFKAAWWPWPRRAL